MSAKQREQDEARRELRKFIRPGATVWTVLRHVSRSGMMRHIDLYVIRKNRPRWISGLVAKALSDTTDAKTGAVKAGGCGMDMGFHLVHSLSCALHGYKSKGDDAKEARTKGVPFWKPRPGHYRAGYSLGHEWL